VLVLVDVGQDQDRSLRLRARRLASSSNGLMTERDDSIVLLLRGCSAKAIGAHVTHELRQPDRHSVMIAVGRPVTGVERIAEAHREVRQTLRIALALGQRGRTVLTEEGDAYGIVFGSTQPDELKHFMDRTLGPLIEHDRERGSELIATLEAWFEHDGNMAGTAKAAFVHVNTLYKRLERVDGLLGEGWRRPDERLQIHLALRLRRLAATLDDASAP
jgi:DNA-binding PucR family transcriptional regulator